MLGFYLVNVSFRGQNRWFKIILNDDKENPFQDKWPIVFHIEIKPIEFIPTLYK